MADRNRRLHDHPVAGRHRTEGWFRHASILRRPAGTGGQRRDAAGRRDRGQPGDRRLWPGQARTLFGDHERFEQTYFSTFKNMYFSGDGARRDEDGYYWITGRVDDVLNVSGHRLGTAEIESALVSHPKIAEAAVVGIPHNIKGQAIYAYVTLNHGEEPTPELYAEVRNWVRKEIGPLATPDVLHWTDSLPKTRSGKIMRRILRKIAAGDTSNLGDTSTLADPGVVDKLLEEKQAIAMPS